MNAWEEFGRKIMNEFWGGACEIDCEDVQEWALEAGLIEAVEYDPEAHGDGPADFDAQPGDLIHAYRAEYRAQAS